MSAPLGGASFELRALVQQFKDDLAAARVIAAEAARDIDAALTGQGGGATPNANKVRSALSAAAESLKAINQQDALPALSSNLSKNAGALSDLLAVLETVPARLSAIGSQFETLITRLESSRTTIGQLARTVRQDIAILNEASEAVTIAREGLTAITAQREQAVAAITSVLAASRETGAEAAQDFGGVRAALAVIVRQAELARTAVASVGTPPTANRVAAATAQSSDLAAGGLTVEESARRAATAVNELTAAIAASGKVAQETAAAYRTLAQAAPASFVQQLASKTQATTQAATATLAEQRAQLRAETQALNQKIADLQDRQRIAGELGVAGPSNQEAAALQRQRDALVVRAEQLRRAAADEVRIEQERAAAIVRVREEEAARLQALVAAQSRSSSVGYGGAVIPDPVQAAQAVVAAEAAIRTAQDQTAQNAATTAQAMVRANEQVAASAALPAWLKPLGGPTPAAPGNQFAAGMTADAAADEAFNQRQAALAQQIYAAQQQQAQGTQALASAQQALGVVTVQLTAGQEATAAAASATNQALAIQTATTRDLTNVQKALNTARGAEARAIGGVTTGGETIANSVTALNDALTALQASDPAAAFTALTRGERLAQAALDELNASIQSLRAQGVRTLDEVEAEITAYLQRGQGVPQSLLSEAENAGEGSSLARQLTAENNQAKVLTSTLDQTRRALRDLAEGNTTATGATKGLTAAQQQQAAILAERAQLQAQLAAGGALGANANTIGQTIAELQRLGLSQAEATKGAYAIEKAFDAAGKARGITDLQTGLRDIALLEQRVLEGQRLIAQGNAQGATIAFGQAKAAGQQALVDLETQAAALRGSGATSPAAAGLLGDFQQRISAARSALGSLEPALKATNQGLGDLEVTGRRAGGYGGWLHGLATAVQNFFGAINEGATGRGIGGTGRLAAFFADAGITGGTVAALGLAAALTALTAATVGVVKEGLAFDSFLEITKVRLEAATGSATQAQAALDDLLSRSRGAQFGFFSVEDLAKGDETLKRIGDDSALEQQRIANAAAATGRTYAETATQIAHFRDVVANGQPFGDILLSLERQGIITSEYAARLREAEKLGLSTAETTEIINQALDRFAGTSEKAGRTAEGSFGRIKNSLGQLVGFSLSYEFEALAKSADQLAGALTANGGLLESLKLLGAFLGGPATIKLAADHLGTELVNGAQNITYQPGDVHEAVAPPRTTTPAQDQAALEAGRQAVAAYAQGFTQNSQQAFQAIDGLVRQHFAALGQQQFTLQAQIDLVTTGEPALAKLIDEIQRTGTYSQESADTVKQAFGDESVEVLRLADAFAATQRNADALARAQTALAAATKQLKDDQALRDDPENPTNPQVAQNVLKLLQDSAAQHRTLHDAAVSDLQDQLSNLQDTAKTVDEGYASILNIMGDRLKTLQDAAKAHQQQSQAVIQGLQTSLQQYQDQVDDRRAAAQAAIDALSERLKTFQDEVQQAQSALSEHQAAYQAVLAGTVEYFNAEHQQQDAITQAIIAKWDAEIGGLRRAKGEADAKVKAETEQEHQLTLLYDRRAAAARAAGREDQARAIERERDRVLARTRQAGTVARDEAAVASDRLGDATAQVQQSAADQQSRDQVAVNAAQARAKAAQDELTAAQQLEQQRQAAEAEEIKRRQRAIAAVQEAQRVQAEADQAAITAEETRIDHQKTLRQQAADLATDQQRAVQQRIDDENRRYKDQKAHDDQAILDQQTIVDRWTTYWKDRIAADQKSVDFAQGVVTALKDQQTALGETTSLILAQNKAWDDQRTIVNDIVDKLKTLYPALSGGSSAPVTPPPAPTPAPPPAPAPAPTSRPALIDAAGYPFAPDGYHPETDARGKRWFVPDGHTLDEYPEGQAAKAGAAAGRAGRSLGAGLAALGSAQRQFANGGPLVEPILGIGLASGASYAFGEAGGREWVVNQQQMQALSQPGSFALHIGQVNASDPRDVDALVERVAGVVMGTGLVALETAKRGGLVTGRRR